MNRAEVSVFIELLCYKSHRSSLLQMSFLKFKPEDYSGVIPTQKFELE